MYETIMFRGQPLIVFTDAAGQKWVAVRPICEGLEIDEYRQMQKLSDNQQFSCQHMSMTGADGKTYKMFCIHISQVNAWLFSINANKVAAQVRNNLLAYQRECQQVLFQHFMPQGGTVQDLSAVLTRIDSMETRMTKGFAALQGEVDDLRSMVHIMLSDDYERELRSEMQKTAEHTKLDGRVIAGYVRRTLGTSGIYNVADYNRVIQVLRNMRGTVIYDAIGEGTVRLD